MRTEWILLLSVCAVFIYLFLPSVFFTSSEGEERYQLLPLSHPCCPLLLVICAVGSSPSCQLLMKCGRYILLALCVLQVQGSQAWHSDRLPRLLRENKGRGRAKDWIIPQTP